MGISDSKDYSSSSFPISTSARDSLSGSMSLQMGTASRSRLLTLFLKNADWSLSHCRFLQTSLPGSSRNWKYHSQDKLD